MRWLRPDLDELCRHTKWRLRRGGRHFVVYLADFFGAFVEGIRLRLNKLSLDSDHILEILGLAEFVHEREWSGSGFGRVVHKFFI
jgi:hypothetical protein